MTFTSSGSKFGWNQRVRRAKLRIISEAEYEGDDEGDGGGLFGFIKNAAASYKENQLRKEFKEMDRDGGGFVDIAELSTYIIKEWFRFRNDRWSKNSLIKYLADISGTSL